MGELYQRKSLSTGEDVGVPGPLPEDLRGALTDEDLARLGQIVSPEMVSVYGDAGFFPAADPPPPPDAPIISPYEFLKLFTTAERVGILTVAQTNMAIADWLNMLNHVSAVHLDDPNTIVGVQALEGAHLIAAGRAAGILANKKP